MRSWESTRVRSRSKPTVRGDVTVATLATRHCVVGVRGSTEAGGSERVALVQVTALVAGDEPLLTLRAGSMGPGLGRHSALNSFWVRSSPTADAAESADSMSAWVKGFRKVSPLEDWGVHATF